jgi:hypothetical protein
MVFIVKATQCCFISGVLRMEADGITDRGWGEGEKEEGKKQLT